MTPEFITDSVLQIERSNKGEISDHPSGKGLFNDLQTCQSEWALRGLNDLYAYQILNWRITVQWKLVDIITVPKFEIKGSVNLQGFKRIKVFIRVAKA